MGDVTSGRWTRQGKERTEVYTRRVRLADVAATVAEALEALDAGNEKRAATLLLVAVHRLAYPDDPREIRVRRVQGGRDL